jgi:hypothetical protein
MADAQVALAGAFHSRGGTDAEDDSMDLPYAYPFCPPNVEKKLSRRKVQYAMEVDEPGPVVEHVSSSTAPGANDGEEEEPDFPEVNLDELLESFDEQTLGAVDGDETNPVQIEEAKRKQTEPLQG